MRNSTDFTHLIDAYLQTIRGPEPESFQRAREESHILNKEGISLSRTEAEVLSFFVQLLGAKKFVEIGTLTGYSALWILQSMPTGGKLWTFEKEPRHATAARRVLSEARLTGKEHVVVEGDAEIELEKICFEGPFDGIFIDGNKAAYAKYLAWAKRNVRRGGLVICDNVFLGGAVLGEESESAARFSEKQVEVLKEVNRDLLATDDFRGVLIPTREGLAVAVKL